MDDILATGGTAVATCDLLERAGAKVVAFEAVAELGFLGGRDRLGSRVVHSHGHPLTAHDTRGTARGPTTVVTP